jgi:hypothetical protein
MDEPIIPLAVTMVAGPQIMTAIVFVTHAKAVRVSLAFLVGVTLAMVAETVVWYLVAGGIDLGDGSDKGSVGHIIQYVLVAILVFLALRTYRNREHVEPPKWLGGLLEASTFRAFTIGLLLILLMPTDVATMASVGIHLQHNGHSLGDAAGFWGLTLLIAALPLLAYVLLHRRAVVAMPKVRDWMGTNAWLVNIVVLGIFVVLILG